MCNVKNDHLDPFVNRNVTHPASEPGCAGAGPRSTVQLTTGSSRPRKQLSSTNQPILRLIHSILFLHFLARHIAVLTRSNQLFPPHRPARTSTKSQLIHCKFNNSPLKMTQTDALQVQTDNEARRVKLYILDEEQWLDQGTGYVGLVKKEEPGREASLHLVVVLEGTDEILLDTLAQIHGNFEHQDDTLILWNDLESGKDFALSFQDKDGCTEIYNSIMEFFKSLGYQGAETLCIAENDAPKTDYRNQQLELPTISNLMELAPYLDFILHDATMYQRANVQDQICGGSGGQPEWFEKLVDLVDPLADLLDDDASEQELLDVRLLVHCLKSVLFLNDARLWNLAASPSFAPNVLKTLECTHLSVLLISCRR